jgi:hypothetical protein
MNICTEFENGRGDVPNAETIAAIEELEKGGGESFDSIEELMADLNADEGLITGLDNG